MQRSEGADRVETSFAECDQWLNIPLIVSAEYERPGYYGVECQGSRKFPLVSYTWPLVFEYLQTNSPEQFTQSRDLHHLCSQQFSLHQYAREPHRQVVGILFDLPESLELAMTVSGQRSTYRFVRKVFHEGAASYELHWNRDASFVRGREWHSDNQVSRALKKEVVPRLVRGVPASYINVVHQCLAAMLQKFNQDLPVLSRALSQQDNAGLTPLHHALSTFVGENYHQSIRLLMQSMHRALGVQAPEAQHVPSANATPAINFSAILGFLVVSSLHLLLFLLRFVLHQLGFVQHRPSWGNRVEALPPTSAEPVNEVAQAIAASSAKSRSAFFLMLQSEDASVWLEGDWVLAFLNCVDIDETPDAVYWPREILSHQSLSNEQKQRWIQAILSRASDKAAIMLYQEGHQQNLPALAFDYVARGDVNMAVLDCVLSHVAQDMHGALQAAFDDIAADARIILEANNSHVLFPKYIHFLRQIGIGKAVMTSLLEASIVQVVRVKDLQKSQALVAVYKACLSETEQVLLLFSPANQMVRGMRVSRSPIFDLRSVTLKTIWVTQDLFPFIVQQFVDQPDRLKASVIRWVKESLSSPEVDAAYRDLIRAEFLGNAQARQQFSQDDLCHVFATGYAQAQDSFESKMAFVTQFRAYFTADEWASFVFDRGNDCLHSNVQQWFDAQNAAFNDQFREVFADVWLAEAFVYLHDYAVKLESTIRSPRYSKTNYQHRVADFLKLLDCLIEGTDYTPEDFKDGRYATLRAGIPKFKQDPAFFILLQHLVAQCREELSSERSQSVVGKRRDVISNASVLLSAVQGRLDKITPPEAQVYAGASAPEAAGGDGQDALAVAGPAPGAGNSGWAPGSPAMLAAAVPASAAAQSSSELAVLPAAGTSGGGSA